ncbi:MAG: hypothetical protein QW488_05750, partial [Acidilobaceae archaeon]
TEVSNYLAKSLRGVHGFGSSDDKRVSSHLFRVQEDFNLFLSKLESYVFLKAEKDREALEMCFKATRDPVL